MYIIQGYQYITFEWFMTAVTFLIVLIRLYVRVYLYGSVWNSRSWRWSEIFVIIGWLLNLGVTICDSLANDANTFNVEPGFKMTDEDTIFTLKVYWAWAFFYKPSIYAVKAALLCFYAELISREQHRILWIAIWVTAVLNGMGTLSQILYNALECFPIQRQWAVDDPACNNHSLAYQLTTYGFHIVTDLLVFALPFPILKSALQRLTPVQKSGAALMFGLGIINVGTAIMLFALRLAADGSDNVPDSAVVVVLTLMYTIQSSTAIAIPCLPQIRLFVNGIAGERRSKRSGAEAVGNELGGANRWSAFWRAGSQSKVDPSCGPSSGEEAANSLEASETGKSSVGEVAAYHDIIAKKV